jgi:hypothetical protein
LEDERLISLKEAAAHNGRYLKQIAELSAQGLPILQTYVSVRAVPVARGRM